MRNYALAPAFGSSTDETVIGPPPGPPAPSTPLWTPPEVSAPVVVDMPPYVAANSSPPAPAHYHWARPALVPGRIADIDPNATGADLPQVVLDEQVEREQLLMSGPPGWLLPAIAGAVLLGGVAFAVAGNATLWVQRIAATLLAALA